MVDKSTDVVKPYEEAFDSSAEATTARFAAVLLCSCVGDYIVLILWAVQRLMRGEPTSRVSLMRRRMDSSTLIVDAGHERLLGVVARGLLK